MKRIVLTLTLIASAATAAVVANGPKVAMIYDAGSKFDRSFNQSAYEGSIRAVERLGATSTDYEPARPEDIPGQIQKFIADDTDIIFGVGYNNNENLSTAARANPNVKFGLIDDVSPVTKNVLSITFKEEEGGYLVGYLAALSSSTNTLGFVGGMNIPLIYRFVAGFKAGAKAANPKIKVFSKYVSTTPDGWDDPATAYRQAGELRSKGADIIFAAAGNSGTGVIKFINDEQCIKAAQLPKGAAFTGNPFRNVARGKDYSAKCSDADRPLFFIGVDSNQNYLGDTDKKPATLNHGLTSMLKRVDNTVFSVIRQVENGSFKGGEVRFGVREGGVGYALDEYNRALMTPETVRKIEAVKSKIVRQTILVPFK